MRARLDQHYLVSEEVRDAIIAGAALSGGEAVLEIGPGRGILTRELVKRARTLTVVEMDERLSEGLSKEFGGVQGFVLVRSDFLKINLNGMSSGPYKVVANLPYSVATPILQKLLDWGDWTEAVLMFQKEVAERITAVPGTRDYGVLTLSVLLKAEAERLFDVSRESFRPRPKVQSSVVRLTRLAGPRLGAGAEKFFFRIAKAAFGQRRKMAAGLIAAALKIERGKVEAELERLGVSPRCRAEQIPLESFLDLAKALG